MRLFICFVIAVLLILSDRSFAKDQQPPESIWIEAETLGALRGSNFSFQKPAQTTKGSWSLAGPDVAQAWTQGGESGFMSVASRADEEKELVIGRDIQIPVDATYMLWVRYNDYRGKKSSFGVRLKQGDSVSTHVFGEHPVVDDLDPMKLLWDSAFGWDHAEMKLGTVLATADGKPVAIAIDRERGRLIFVSAKMGLGIDQRPLPVLATMMQHLTANLLPFRIDGNVERIISQTRDGHWLITLLNNRGVIKPQHGVLPTNYHEAQSVSIAAAFSVGKSKEWIAHEKIEWKKAADVEEMQITVPAGSVRMIDVERTTR